VGVFPVRSSSVSSNSNLPHTRGGVSVTSSFSKKHTSSSPHPWGCFRAGGDRRMTIFIFPTPVGVFLLFRCYFGRPDYLPHTRGGVSRPHRGRLKRRKSSPHPWGCFSSSGRGSPGVFIFPTPVGVFLACHSKHAKFRYLPHTRGGVSLGRSRYPGRPLSSPHPWGCF